MLKKLFPKPETIQLNYNEVTTSLVKIQKILDDAKSQNEVDVAERMFNNFLKMFSTPQERQSSHIIYGVQMAINEHRAKFDKSSETPYTYDQLNFRNP